MPLGYKYLFNSQYRSKTEEEDNGLHNLFQLYKEDPEVVAYLLRGVKKSEYNLATSDKWVQSIAYFNSIS